MTKLRNDTNFDIEIKIKNKSIGLIKANGNYIYIPVDQDKRRLELTLIIKNKENILTTMLSLGTIDQSEILKFTDNFYLCISR